jgi:Sec-independent protein translocase protein TatA
MKTQQQQRSRLVAFLVLMVLGTVSHAFVSPGVATRPLQSQPGWTSPPVVSQQQRSIQNTRSSSSTELNMFMGSDGGILGIGTPELFTILLVGYFVLGPSDLYKLTKEIGKFVQNIQTFSRDATAQLEDTLESNLQVEEIRKAQRDLNEAFNFRRSINVEADTDPFEVNAKSPREVQPDIPFPSSPSPSTSESSTAGGEAVAAATGAAAAAPKKIRRRRVRKVVEEEPAIGDVNQGTVTNNIPDLDMADGMSEAERSMMASMELTNEQFRKEKEQEDLDSAADRRQSYLQRLEAGQPRNEAEEEGIVQEELAKSSEYDLSTTDADAGARFQSQMSGNWNDQMLAMEDDLTPLAEVMERLAILEDEKNSADARLQEEFRLREENEERYYKEKRVMLQEAAAKIQAQAYAANTTPAPNTTATTTK